MNFIAFRFTDNDFHSALRQAVEYVATNRDEPDMSLAAWREFVIRGLVGFSSLSRISDWALENHRDIRRGYFEEILHVSEIKTIDELDSGFEGYVFDKNLGVVFYQGY